MPPKRKSTSNVIEESPTKRLTRSSGLILTDNKSLKKSTKITAAKSPTSRKAPSRTYGKNHSRVLSYVNSSGEDKAKQGLREVGKADAGTESSEESEDELNLARSSASPEKTAVVSQTGKGNRRVLKQYSTRKRGLQDKGPSQGLRSEVTATSDNEPMPSVNLRAMNPPRTPTKPVKESCVHNSTTSSGGDHKSSSHVYNEDSQESESDRHDETNKSTHRQHDRPVANDVQSPHKSRKRRLSNSLNTHTPRSSSRKKLRLDAVTSASTFDERTRTSISPSPIQPIIESEYSLPLRSATRSLLPISPSKKSLVVDHFPACTSDLLPQHLHSCLNTRKRAILRTLQRPPDLFSSNSSESVEDTELGANEVAFQQLTNVLTGTVTRGEGNSCLLLGPRGSGKSRLVERCISNLSEKVLVIRLSGWTQRSDRLAMREIAYQLGQQTGTSFLAQAVDTPEASDIDDDNQNREESNPFLDKPTALESAYGVSLPPSSHLPSLISILPTLSLPTIVVLDGFDMFALHPRQSLLYCLLDTAQSCRANAVNKGLAVIGITSRVDTVNMLEKRVKSRFSGRIVKTSPFNTVEDWIHLTKAVFTSNIKDDSDDNATADEWQLIWETATDKFLSDKAVCNTLNDTFSVTRDIRMLSRMLTSLTLQLSPTSPFPSSSQLALTALSQRARPQFPSLYTLPYPAICLLIASVHSDTAGHPIFTFEMLYEYFRNQVRASTSAPVQLNGGSIGMVRCSRDVLMTTFEHLVSMKVFVWVSPLSSSTAKEFVRHRSVIDRDEVKKVVDKIGQVNLKKWLIKAQ